MLLMSPGAGGDRCYSDDAALIRDLLRHLAPPRPARIGDDGHGQRFRALLEFLGVGGGVRESVSDCDRAGRVQRVRNLERQVVVAVHGLDHAARQSPHSQQARPERSVVRSQHLHFHFVLLPVAGSGLALDPCVKLRSLEIMSSLPMS